MKKFKLTLADPFIMKKNQEVYFLACIERFSKFPTAEVFKRLNADNILNFLQEYVLLHGIPRSIRLDKARCQTGHKIKAFCSQNNIQLVEAPIHDHRAIEQLDSLKG